jgi:hypothetical protein
MESDIPFFGNLVLKFASILVIGTDIVETYFKSRAGHRGIKAARAQYDAWLSRPGLELDPDRLMIALQTRTADEWGLYTTGLNSGDRRVAALRDAIMEAYDKVSADAKQFRDSNRF